VAGLRTLLIAAQPVPYGGVIAHVVDLVDGLRQHDLELHVACPRASSTWRELERRDGVVLHATRPPRRPAPTDLSTLATLVPLVRRMDIVHAHSAKAGFLARLAARLTGRQGRCIFTPHGWSFWAAGGAEARLYTALEQRAAHWCRNLVALSTAERDAGLGVGIGRASQYRVIPNGIDLGRFARGPRPVPNRIVTIGRLAPPKRTDLLLRAFAEVRQSCPMAQLQIVGDGPGRSAVERQVQDLGLDESVRLLGHRDDVGELLAEAACLVLASDYEGCPLSIIEAMAAGVPVVATGVGGVGELVDDGCTGFVVPAGDAAGLAKGIGTVLADPEAARDMGAAGRRVARDRLTRGRMVDDLLHLYEEAHAG
jgi:glycosyltransferase involved in cell wall biosynthesis